MAEIPQLHLAGREQDTGYALALNHVVLPGFQTDLIQRRMSECVIPQFEAVVEPDLQSLDALVHLPGLVQLLFVDEPNYGDLLITESTQQFRGHCGDVSCGHAVGHAGGQVVNGYRNLTVGFLGNLGYHGGREDADCAESGEQSWQRFHRGDPLAEHDEER